MFYGCWQGGGCRRRHKNLTRYAHRFALCRYVPPSTAALKGKGSPAGLPSGVVGQRRASRYSERPVFFNQAFPLRYPGPPGFSWQYLSRVTRQKPKVRVPGAAGRGGHRRRWPLVARQGRVKAAAGSRTGGKDPKRKTSFRAFMVSSCPFLISPSSKQKGREANLYRPRKRA